MEVKKLIASHKVAVASSFYSKEEERIRINKTPKSFDKKRKMGSNGIFETKLTVVFILHCLFER
jgi:hypothetical protein